MISIGDWVRGRPGVANASNVRAALDYLVDSGYIIITVRFLGYQSCGQGM